MMGAYSSYRITRRLVHKILAVFFLTASHWSGAFLHRACLRKTPTWNFRLSVESQETGNSSISTSFASSDVGLYVHIPFCRRRCRYCNFAIVPIGDKDLASSRQQEGVDSLQESYTLTILQEIEQLIEKEQSILENGATIPLRSIYFGGGTPSLAHVSSIRRILDSILRSNSPFLLKDNAEITMEMDPGTFDLKQMEDLYALGVNRISLGVQSFADKVLQQIGRQHSVLDIRESLRIVETVNKNNPNKPLYYSMDLISGLPGVTLADWAETLYTAVNTLNPPPHHLSIYDLQVESGTVFGKWYDGEDEKDESRMAATRKTPASDANCPPPLPSDEEAAFQYQYTAGYLRAKGFEHYEVSSYAKLETMEDGSLSKTSPWRSQHNQIYWGYETGWYAVGLGATSFVRKQIECRPRAMADYQSWVQEQRGTQHQKVSCQPLGESPEERTSRLMDVVLKRLRTSQGLNLSWVDDNFSTAHVEAIIRGAQLGLELGLVHRDIADNSLRLQDSKGLLYSNSIISSIFLELEGFDKLE